MMKRFDEKWVPNLLLGRALQSIGKDDMVSSELSKAIHLLRGKKKTLEQKNCKRR